MRVEEAVKWIRRLIPSEDYYAKGDYTTVLDEFGDEVSPCAEFAQRFSLPAAIQRICYAYYPRCDTSGVQEKQCAKAVHDIEQFFIYRCFSPFMWDDPGVLTKLDYDAFERVMERALEKSNSRRVRFT